jgi:hypothetical protein
MDELREQIYIMLASGWGHGPTEAMPSPEKGPGPRLGITLIIRHYSEITP